MPDKLVAWANTLADLVETDADAAVEHIASGRKELDTILEEKKALGVELNVLKAYLWTCDGKAALAFFKRALERKMVLRDALEDVACDVFDQASEQEGFEEVCTFLADFAKEQKWKALAERFALLARLGSPDALVAAVEEVNRRLEDDDLPFRTDDEQLARAACVACIRAKKMDLAAQYLPRLKRAASWDDWKHTDEFKRLLASPAAKKSGKK